MYQVTLQISKRKTESLGFYANEDVATHVAAAATGYDDGEGPANGVVTPVDIDTSASVEEYDSKAEAAAALEREVAWATFYEGLTETERALLVDRIPASIQLYR